MTLDLNALRVFERVASLRSFSAAARSLGLSRSSVSRCITQLEMSLGTRLLQRSTRDVVLTTAGQSLIEHCLGALEKLDDAVNHVGLLTAEPRGSLKVSAPIGFGMIVLSEHLPAFLAAYPNVDVILDLVGRPADMISNGIDVAIRIGRLPDSDLVSQKLYTLQRCLCASPAYLERRGVPKDLDALDTHETVELQDPNGRPQTWSFRRGGQVAQVAFLPRVCVNEALTAYRLICAGVGIGLISQSLCRADIEAKRLVHILPEWTGPSVDVHVVYPNRQLAPAVRAFVDFIRTTTQSKPPSREAGRSKGTPKRSGPA